METLKKTAFSVPARNEVSGTNQAIFDQLNKALGFVPNLNAKTSFSNKEKEAINLIVSEVNGCIYCLSAHSVIGKMNGFSDEQLLDIRREKSDNPKLQALVVLAADITKNKGNVKEENLQNFFDQGYTKQHLVDLILQVSDKIAMNYLHNLTKIPVDFPLAESI